MDMTQTTITAITSLGLGTVLAYNGWQYFKKKGEKTDSHFIKKDDRTVEHDRGQNDELVTYIKDQNKGFDVRMDRKEVEQKEERKEFLGSLDKMMDTSKDVANIYRKESEKRTVQLIEMDKKVDMIHYKIGEFDSHLFPFIAKLDRANEDIREIKNFVKCSVKES